MSNTNENITINEKYKDRIFCLLFGREEYKENILSLYNALNDSNYENVDDIEITTIDDALYIKMKNDVSFLIDSYLTLWEQQSTYNPNMPVRGLMYYGNLYNSYIHNRGLNIYRSSLIKLPTPKYVVFYNGTTNRDSIEKLKLSDAFMQEDVDHEFEWTATMINLNTGKNDVLLEKCKVLADYMVLINKIRVYKKKMDNIKDAVNRAVDECIQEGRLVEFLEKHRGEIMANVLTEFNEEVFVRSMKEEGREEAKLENAINLLDILSDEEISMRIGLPLETVQQLRKENE
ncbi:MAG: hypothetical protein J6B96_02775 [Agathobacter sp.]|nr:hypothetical protein [Agathobacter sp.]